MVKLKLKEENSNARCKRGERRPSWPFCPVTAQPHVDKVKLKLKESLSSTNALAMAQPGGCLGHQERENTQNKILKIAERPKETPDVNLRVSIRGRSGQSKELEP